MPALLMQYAFDGIVNRCKRCQNAAGYSFSSVMNEKLAVNSVDTCLVNATDIM